MNHMAEEPHTPPHPPQKVDISVKHVVLILSGKGGVGKSTVAANLALAFSNHGYQTGLLDLDIHGPDIPKMLGIEEAHLTSYDQKHIEPVQVTGTLGVISMAFLLPEKTTPVIWRGPMKMGAIRQFLEDVNWGDLDYLVVDSPPGTGDEPLSVCQLIENPDGAVIVTTPQELAIADVRKCVNFCRQLKLPVLGVIENMSGFVCPKCGELTEIFSAGGGDRMARDMGLTLLGHIPIDPKIVEAGDAGTPYVKYYQDTETAKIFEGIVERIT